MMTDNDFPLYQEVAPGGLVGKAYPASQNEDLYFIVIQETNNGQTLRITSDDLPYLIAWLANLQNELLIANEVNDGNFTT